MLSTCFDHCRLKFGKPPETGAVGHDPPGVWTRMQNIHQRGGESREARGEVSHKSENGSAHAFFLKEMWRLAQLFAEAVSFWSGYRPNAESQENACIPK